MWTSALFDANNIGFFESYSVFAWIRGEVGASADI